MWSVRLWFKYYCIFGDINCDMLKTNVLCDLCDIYDLKNIVSEPTCFKGETPTLLDIFLTNKPKSFCHCINVDTGISDFHNLTGIVTRAHAPQSERRVLTYRSMNHFQHNEFTKDVGFIPFHVCEIFDEVDDILWAQQQLFSSVINAHAPLKRRRIRRRQVPYMNGSLRKIIHQRNMWRNRHFKDKRNTTARSKYIFFRNQATKLMKSSVNTYFRKECENRDSNKKFYKTVKPFLSDKSSCGNNKIILKENDKIVSFPPEVADIVNAFMAPSLIIQLIIMMDLTVFLWKLLLISTVTIPVLLVSKHILGRTSLSLNFKKSLQIMSLNSSSPLTLENRLVMMAFRINS